MQKSSDAVEWNRANVWPAVSESNLLLNFMNVVAIRFLSAVGIAIGYGLDDGGVAVPSSVGGQEFSPHRPDRFRGLSILPSEYRGE
jgi:hypothetical protein